MAFGVSSAVVTDWLSATGASPEACTAEAKPKRQNARMTKNVPQKSHLTIAVPLAERRSSFSDRTSVCILLRFLVSRNGIGFIVKMPTNHHAAVLVSKRKPVLFRPPR